MKKRKEIIVVEVDDEPIKFSLDNVETTFMPRIFDRISLLCEVQRDPVLMNEAGPTLEVKKIEPPINK